jgi:hypothetical protein
MRVTSAIPVATLRQASAKTVAAGGAIGSWTIETLGDHDRLLALLLAGPPAGRARTGRALAEARRGDPSPLGEWVSVGTRTFAARGVDLGWVVGRSSFR